MELKTLRVLCGSSADEIGFLFAPVAGGWCGQGSSLQQTMTLGGMTREGKDAVNR